MAKKMLVYEDRITLVSTDSLNGTENSSPHSFYIILITYGVEPNFRLDYYTLKIFRFLGGQNHLRSPNSLGLFTALKTASEVLETKQRSIKFRAYRH